MRNLKLLLSFAFLILILSTFFFLPVKEVFLFSETNSESKIYYMKINKQKEFEIKYVHSIHLTDVIETYEVTKNQKIRLRAMTYENLSIGLPGEAGEGESLELVDGVYTLTYDDKVIDSFTIRIGRVDADLSFRYDGDEVDLKEYLEKGNSYEFKIKKLTFYQLMKGANLNG